MDGYPFTENLRMEIAEERRESRVSSSKSSEETTCVNRLVSIVSADLIYCEDRKRKKRLESWLRCLQCKIRTEGKSLCSFDTNNTPKRAHTIVSCETNLDVL